MGYVQKHLAALKYSKNLPDYRTQMQVSQTTLTRGN